MPLKLVWEPLRIRIVELKNRVARASNSTTILPNSVNEDFIAYHRARARGGVGLSILEGGAVHPNSQSSYLIDDSAMDGFEALMTAVRPEGMRVFQQLWHGGHNLGGKDGSMPWSSSATPSVLGGMIGVPMGREEIQELTAAFATAAVRCRDAGLDGVEIHAAHGYLFSQFLSPLTNLRVDEYNGNLLDRARFLIEVLHAVRAAVGPDFPIGVRMGSSDAKGGLTAEDVATVASHLEGKGLIDFLDITHSDYFNLPGMAHTMAYPSGYQLPINEVIAKSVSIPRLVTGLFRTLEEAEQVLRSHQADLISLVRAHIADPDLVRKTAQGRVEDVRPCIACNQGCVGGLLQIGRMRCTVNPAAGYEKFLDEELIVKATIVKKVMIVGGGPAGLEAARIAALGGHNVTLVEAGAQLGGALRVAQRAPHLHILGDLIDWQARQVLALGVDVQLNSYVEAHDILAAAPDVTIVATGGMPRGDGRQALIPGEPPSGMGVPHIFDPAILLLGPQQSLEGKSALVFDDVGRYEAIAAADYLQRAGAAITFVTSLSSFAAKMMGTSRDTEALMRLNQGGKFRLVVNHNLLAIEPGFASIRALGVDHLDRMPADIVVVATYPLPVRDLYDELRHRVPDIRLVGDALSPRDLLAAIADGHRVARTI